MVTQAEAYAIDPNTGSVNMDLFRQYAAQQEASLANMRATVQLTPAQQYMQANPDVLGHATRTAAAEGIAPGEEFGLRTQQIAGQHFRESGNAEGRSGFGLPLSMVGQPPEIINTPIMTQPYLPPAGPTTPSIPTTPTMNNFGPAPQAGQIPGYSFTSNPAQYANTLGNFGGLLADTSPFYAGQVPTAPGATATQPAGYNIPELARYPNANYNAGAFTPIIYTY